ncbi:sulfatase-like hydrolase/transferase [Halopiger thermotolerans]
MNENDRTPNIVWLTLDSVRQDHTTMGGYHRNTTPNIQAVADAADGVAFSNCIAHAPATRPSGPSILSGTYPSRHGTYYGDKSAFPKNLPTVSELLSKVGYRTAAVSNNGFVGPATGVDRGFDDFTLLGSSPLEIWRNVGSVSLAKYLLNIRRHSVGFSTDFHSHSGAYLVNEVAKRHIREFGESDKPGFLYVHYNEPHRGYYPPLPYLDTFSDELNLPPREAASISMDIHHNLLDVIANGIDLTEEEMAALKAMYDAEIAYTDDRVGALLDVVERELDDVIIVITSDHGELFGEDDMLAHKYSMHNAVLEVPLVVRGIDGLSDDTLVQHADIIKTLLQIVGAETGSVQGVDLRENHREYAISQYPGGSLDPLVERNPDFDTSRFPTKPYAVIQDGSYKFAEWPGKGNLYELPDEETNIRDTKSKHAAELKSALSEWLSVEGEPVTANQKARVDDELRDHLRDLGYLDSEI